jgi:hypothetical protein
MKLKDQKSENYMNMKLTFTVSVSFITELFSYPNNKNQNFMITWIWVIYFILLFIQTEKKFVCFLWRFLKI